MNDVFTRIRRSGVRRGPQRLLGGVCGPIAARIGSDVWLIRGVVGVLFLVPPGIGVAGYLGAWVLLPWQDGSIPLERFLSRSQGTVTAPRGRR
ncbi:PspC domain-containing protein [Georgenia sp. 10Sc9-8]|uniref:PspC domain-containing protein n=1 Tax=Georgenia halotolerans TaxID=3028317 RepID=A0ABT5U0N2_9MICO|nr:PspC domain-containing protein [Georgenia halotolerans]